MAFLILLSGVKVKYGFQKGRLPPVAKVYTNHSPIPIKAHLIRVNINYSIIMEDEYGEPL